ncbi:MAG: serine hydrolase [Alphaproteobacteria bacterium]|nr:serine hydrolase [Alphaproteobacteria bacterium]
MLTTGWADATPESVGFAPDLAERLDAAMAAGRLPGLHAVVLARHGAMVMQLYYAGEDERWGHPLGCVAHNAATRHDLRSVSKSIVGLLYGIALAAGKVPLPASPLLDNFPGLADLAADPARRRLTVGHALSMTLGLEWNENLPYTDPNNSEIAMEMAADRCRYILSRPIVTPPGERWTYSGGNTALLGHLISRGTGMPLHDFARTALFAPLGITDTEWVASTNGEAAAASGLRLRPVDLARIGQCVLDGGRAEGQQIIPADWLGEALSRKTSIDAEIDYGWQWYLYNASSGGAPWHGAFGNGGQRLIVVPRLGIVLAILCGNYNRPDQGLVPRTVLREFVLAALAK